MWNIEQYLLVEVKSLYEHAEKIHAKNTHAKYMRALKSHAETESYHENVWNIEQCLLVKGKSKLKEIFEQTLSMVKLFSQWDEQRKR